MLIRNKTCSTLPSLFRSSFVHDRADTPAITPPRDSINPSVPVQAVASSTPTTPGTNTDPNTPRDDSKKPNKDNKGVVKTLKSEHDELSPALRPLAPRLTDVPAKRSRSSHGLPSRPEFERWPPKQTSTPERALHCPTQAHAAIVLSAAISSSSIPLPERIDRLSERVG